MKNILIGAVGLFSWLTVYSQADYSAAELKQKCDSIIEESNILYRYETASWNFTDMLLAKPDILKTIGNYLTYQQGDTIKCIVVDNQSQCSYEASFLTDSAPCSESTVSRSLSAYEKQLISIRGTIRSALEDNKKYPIVSYKDFPLNWILIPFAGGYKFYAISGTSKSRVIPFGNDYLFISDKEGRIQSWKKFHSRLIPVEATDDMPIVSMPVHSHLRQEPFISATDICTFRLYYNQTGSTKFAVYSVALSMYFIYEIATNKITPTKDLELNLSTITL